MPNRILIFPAGLPEAETFASMARREGRVLVGASSLADDPARTNFDAWAKMPYVHHSDFAAALRAVLDAHGIEAIFSSHATVRHRISVLLPQIAPGVVLLDRLRGSRRAEMPHAWHATLAASLGAQAAALPCAVEISAMMARALAMRGESGPGKLATMLALGSVLPPGDLVEVGALSGRSAFVIGWMARRFGLGPVLVLDPWTQDDAVQHDAPTVLRDATRSLDFGDFLAEFLENLIPSFHGSLNYYRARAEAVRPVYREGFTVGPTEFGTTIYSGAIALLHIDGNHDFAAVTQDLADWVPLVRPGGWVIVDDYVWSFGDGPRRAGDTLLARGGINCSFVCDGALFLRIED
jgi:hypothetical protein